MSQLKKELKVISRDLKSLTQKTEKMIKAVAQFEKEQAKPVAASKGTAKKVAARKGKEMSATEAVLKIINRNKKGINTAKIQARTGYNTRKIWDIVHRAYKEGKIKKVGRGTYVKA